MKFKNQRITKSILETAKLRREEIFRGKTEQEIQRMVPVNKAYLYEYENEYATGVGIFVQDCIVCGCQHKHGNAGEGTYSNHCDIGNEEAIPFNYELQLDWSDEDNIRLAKKYGIERK